MSLSHSTKMCLIAIIITNANACSINTKIHCRQVWKSYFTVNMHLDNFPTYPPKEYQEVQSIIEFSISAEEGYDCETC